MSAVPLLHYVACLGVLCVPWCACHPILRTTQAIVATLGGHDSVVILPTGGACSTCTGRRVELSVHVCLPNS